MEGRVKPEDNARCKVHVRGARQGALKGAKARLRLACVPLITLLLTAPAAAGTHILAGAEWDTRGQSFSYAGAGASKQLAEKTHVTGQLFAGHLKYSFDENGRTLDAKTPIVNPSVGLKYDGEAYTIAGSVGADFRKPERELASGGTEGDSKTGASLQIEAYRWLSEKKSLGLILSYSTIDDFFWTRARGKSGVYETGPGDIVFAGIELIAMGNSDFSATQAGGFVELATKSGLSVLLKAGVKNSDAFNTGGYGGIELYKGF